MRVSFARSLRCRWTRYDISAHKLKQLTDCRTTVARRLFFISSSQTCSSRRCFASSTDYDPMARRPNKVCDPYGQGGKPLSRQEAHNLLATIDKEWKLVLHQEPTTLNDDDTIPTRLTRDFYHKDYLEASQFVAKIAAIGHVQNHYPTILLERRLLPRAWQVVTQVTCHTKTLGGLSYNDFHLAMQIDVEIKRPEVARLLLSDEDSQRKVT